MVRGDNAFVSVPSFGDSFFIKSAALLVGSCKAWFPSPHSGILFLFVVTALDGAVVIRRFRPLIRGFFFYTHQLLFS